MTHKVVSAAGTANPIGRDGKRLRAREMSQRGAHFVVAANRCRQADLHEWVYLQNLCQGIELIVTAMLLFRDYDGYMGGLRDFGHDLGKLERTVRAELRLMDEDSVRGFLSHHIDNPA